MVGTEEIKRMFLATNKGQGLPGNGRAADPSVLRVFTKGGELWEYHTDRVGGREKSRFVSSTWKEGKKHPD